MYTFKGNSPKIAQIMVSETRVIGTFYVEVQDFWCRRPYARRIPLKYMLLGREMAKAISGLVPYTRISYIEIPHR